MTFLVNGAVRAIIPPSFSENTGGKGHFTIDVGQQSYPDIKPGKGTV